MDDHRKFITSTLLQFGDIAGVDDLATVPVDGLSVEDATREIQAERMRLQRQLERGALSDGDEKRLKKLNTFTDLSEADKQRQPAYLLDVARMDCKEFSQQTTRFDPLQTKQGGLTNARILQNMRKSVDVGKQAQRELQWAAVFQKSQSKAPVIGM